MSPGADWLQSSGAAQDTLTGHFKERMYDPIRRSTRLAEAPSHRQTIFEYAPDSQGAEDYRKLVDRYVASAVTKHDTVEKVARSA